MTESKTAAKAATPALLAKVKAVIAESKNHRYSVSRVYEAYNEAFGKTETPQSCATCLRNRVIELERWLTAQLSSRKAEQPETPAPVTIEKPKKPKK